MLRNKLEGTVRITIPRAARGGAPQSVLSRVSASKTLPLLIISGKNARSLETIQQNLKNNRDTCLEDYGDRKAESSLPAEMAVSNLEVPQKGCLSVQIPFEDQPTL